MCRIIFPSGVICVRDVVYAAYVRRTSLQICPRFFLGVHHSVQGAQYPPMSFLHTWVYTSVVLQLVCPRSS